MKQRFRYEPGVPAHKLDPPEHFLPSRGEVLKFGAAADARDATIDFEIPAFPGMDELYVVHAEIEASAAAVDQDPLAVPAPIGDARVVALPDGDPRAGSLVRVTLQGLVVEGAPATGWTLHSTKGPITWRGPAAPTADTAADCRPLRLIARLPKGNTFGPPVAAAPAFPMPADPGKLYGDALAGAKVSAELKDGKVGVTLTFTPPLAARRLELRLVASPEVGSLPHEASPARWRADALDAIWTTFPIDLEIEAQIPALPDLPAAPVASFPGAAASGARTIDFSAAARSLLRTAYAEKAATKLALHLRSGSAGQINLHKRIVEAEYRRRLVGEEGLAIALRGGVERVSLPLPKGLAPARFTLTFDGRFGPFALITAADTGELDPAAPRSGYRVADALAVARWLPLTTPEAARKLTRVSVEGRGAGDCELLLALHHGDPQRIGARHGDPVALAVPSEAKSRWHRAELAAAAAAPPHPGGVWLVAQVSRGAFWWAADFADPAGSSCQRSPDAGTTWNTQSGRPRAQVHQEWLEGTPPEPRPEPIVCTWHKGQLHKDIRPPGQREGPAFRGLGLPLLGERDLEAGASDVPLDQVVELATLDLAFASRRDVDFRLLDAVMTYHPWLSGGP